VLNKFYKLAEQNICTYRIIYMNCRNKTNMYTVEQIIQTTRTKYLYVPNKLYEVTQQLIEEEHIFIE
jgi:hypothetical protein